MKLNCYLEDIERITQTRFGQETRKEIVNILKYAIDDAYAEGYEAGKYDAQEDNQ